MNQGSTLGSMGSAPPQGLEEAQLSHYETLVARE